METSGGDVSCTFVTLAQMPLVNVDSTTWEQIFEFRKDTQAKAKLRRLYAFAQTSYQGRDRNFVEADLMTRLEDFENTVRDWGFETMHSSLSLLITSKSLWAAAGAAMSAALFNAPTLAVVAAAGGAATEIGRLTLRVSKQRFELSRLKRDHPLGYLILARDTLESKQ